MGIKRGGEGFGDGGVGVGVGVRVMTRIVDYMGLRDDTNGVGRIV